MQVISNTAGGTPANYKDAVWTGSFDDDQEAFITITADVSAFDVGPHVKARWDTATNLGYRVEVNMNATPHVCSLRTGAGVGSAVGATVEQTFAVGDKIGIECIGTTISMYRWDGASWSQVLTRTDSTYTSGKIGFYTDKHARRYDDFGGGSVVAAAPFVLPHRVVG